MQYWVNSLGIEDTEVSIKQGKVTLVIKGITPKEYAKIANRYQADKVVSSTMAFAGQTKQDG